MRANIYRKISSRIEKTHYQFKIPGCATLIIAQEVAAKYYKVEPLDEEPLEASINQYSSFIALAKHRVTIGRGICM